MHKHINVFGYLCAFKENSWQILRFSKTNIAWLFLEAASLKSFNAYVWQTWLFICFWLTLLTVTWNGADESVSYNFVHTSFRDL